MQHAYMLALASHPCNRMHPRSVIILEDALLHPQLPVVVWAMMAHVSRGMPGAAWGPAHAARGMHGGACMGGVHGVCICGMGPCSESCRLAPCLI